MAFLRNALLVLVTALVLAAWVVIPVQGAAVLALLLALWLVFTRSGTQARSVAAVGISTLGQRLGSSAVIVVGIGGVVAVLVSLLAMREGYSETLRRTGGPDSAIVMRGASAAEVGSLLENEDVVQIVQAPQIARDAEGKPLASDEIVAAANLPVLRGGPDDEGSVQVRGVGERAWAVRPSVKIVSGRTFQPGLRELIAGRGAASEFAGLSVGREIHLGAQPWTVVGIFSSGDALESEIWGDARVVADTYRRGARRNSVTVRLADAASFAAFKTGLETNPQLKVEAQTTLEYFEKQSETLRKILTVIGVVVGSIMAIGATFGALNTMFATVAARAREIATLRAIGFSGLPVVAAVLLETMLLALLGGLLGGVLAYILFDGYSASTLAGTGKLSFALRVSPGLLWTGIQWALAIGFVGGLFPAARAARLPVAAALREL